MNRYVADPHWGDLIIAYFFLGGIASGAYATASMARIFGSEADQRAARAADYIAFPLVCICGLILTIDLNRPERFWHMLISSQTLLPIFKWWSPMSIGSWALSLFGALSGLSFLSVLVDDEWTINPRYLWLLKIHKGWIGKLFSALGLAASFFVGSYTGVLLSATNQPGWVQSPWLGALFLASSASTGLAAIALVDRWFLSDIRKHALRHLERADRWAIGLEIVTIFLFCFSFKYTDRRLLFDDEPGWLILWYVVPFGLITPLVLMSKYRRRGTAALAALLILAGGLVLRYAVVSLPGPLLSAKSTEHS